MRAATAAACSVPFSARCSPGARPGSVVPVVGVWPCRTSRTTVGGGGFFGVRGAIGATYRRGHRLPLPRHHRDRRLLRLPAPRRVAGEGRGREAGVLRRRGVLGPTGAGV